MRKMLMLVAVGAILSVPLVGSAGATLPEVPQVPDTDEVCKRVFVPANVRLAAGVEKRITLGGQVLGANVQQEVIRVFKTIEVQVCVRTEGVVTEVDLDEAAVGAADCPDGGEGAHIRVRVPMKAGIQGGAVEAAVKVAVHDEDAVLGQAFDELNVVIEENKRVELPPAEVFDHDTVDLDACVGPVDVD